MSKQDGGLRILFRECLPTFDWQSIETAMTGGGVPDSNFCTKGTEGWIEFKQTAGWAVTLAPEQIGWIARRVRCGGRVFVAVRRRAPGGPRSPAADDLWLFHGRHAREARVGGLRGAWVGKHAHCWVGGPHGWDWAAVAALLVA